MATDKQGSTREQGRQQSADMGPAGSRTQQGSAQGQASAGRDYSGQRGASQYGGNALQTRGGMQPAAWSNYGYGSGPFSVMRRISDEMDRLFEGFGFGRGTLGEEAWPGSPSAGAEQGASLWSPHLEMYERDGKLMLTADLPGVKKEDVKVEVDENVITLQGQRRQEQTNQERGYYRSERSYGTFYRTVPLPEGVDPSTASATFRDGVLHITLQAPKKRSTSRALEIKDETAEGRSGGDSAHGAGGQQR